jgi:hypothetical protein
MPAQNPPNPFPAWRLPNGIINARHEDLERSIGSCERWAWFGGALVVAGVAAEVAIAAYHPLYDSWIEQWGSALANSLVAIGVMFEIMFARLAGLRQSELIRRSSAEAAAANERAGAAEQEAAAARERAAKIEELTAWRHLSEEQFQQFVNALKDVAPSLDVYIEWQNGDPEAYSFAEELFHVFTSAGVPNRITGNQNMWMSGAAFGVQITSAPSIVIATIALAFREAEMGLPRRMLN